MFGQIHTALTSIFTIAFCIGTLAFAGPRPLNVGAGETAVSSRHVLRASLGARMGDSRFNPAGDLNQDGVINALDAAAYRLVHRDRSEPRHDPMRGMPAAGASEQIVVEPQSTVATPKGTVTVLFLIRNNTTPLLGYSLDVEIVPGPDARGTVTADVAGTNFYDVQNVITAGGATRDPFFSVIQDSGDGGVFVNTITDDNSTVLAVDNVNDVLAEVVLNVSGAACGDFTIQLGQSSALSDGDGFPVAFAFVPGTIAVHPCIPTLSHWGMITLTLVLVTAATIAIGKRGAVSRLWGNDAEA